MEIAKFKITESPVPEKTRQARLGAVLKHLDAEGAIGDIDSSSMYFRGAMRMKDGQYEGMKREYLTPQCSLGSGMMVYVSRWVAPQVISSAI